MKKKIFLSLILLVSLLGVKAQSGCTIQANCKQTISLSFIGSDSILLYGIVSSTDGVKSYLWKQVSGPSISTIVSSTANTTYVKGLVPGTYIYNFSAVTNLGTSLAPVPDTLQVLPFIDKIDSIKVFYKSGKTSTNF